MAFKEGLSAEFLFPTIDYSEAVSRKATIAESWKTARYIDPHQPRLQFGKLNIHTTPLYELRIQQGQQDVKFDFMNSSSIQTYDTETPIQNYLNPAGNYREETSYPPFVKTFNDGEVIIAVGDLIAKKELGFFSITALKFKTGIHVWRKGEYQFILEGVSSNPEYTCFIKILNGTDQGTIYERYVRWNHWQPQHERYISIIGEVISVDQTRKTEIRKELGKVTSGELIGEQARYQGLNLRAEKEKEASLGVWRSAGHPRLEDLPGMKRNK